ncbi:D-alanine--D-alanine ligase [Candidatus Shapirobacteria bacterium]|nr:D-alanine--D-alanine ligase [Candidatus Shapirobacteria bacterium]
MEKINLAVVFGGKSLEHEVSIVSTFQAWEWINPQKYNRYLIYIDQNNRSYLCPSLRKENYQQFIKKVLEEKRGIEFISGGFRYSRSFLKKEVGIDVALLILHGAYGEDGRVQGMLDFYGIPFTCSGVLGSALGMDKVEQKNIFEKLGLPITPYLWFYDFEYQSSPQKIKLEIKKCLKYPLFVKPANGGSSVGVTKVKEERGLDQAVQKVSQYDHKILVEQSVGGVDINCSVMGGYELRVTPCEQPLSEDEFLSFREKYLKGGKTKGMAGLSRIIPAPIPDEVAGLAQEMAKKVFRELGCWGMARMDFLYQKETQKIYLNEINTIPGSLAFYLWQAYGLTPSQMVDELIKLALEREEERARLNYHYQSEILNQK